MTDALFLVDTSSDDAPLRCDELSAGWKITLPQSVKRHAIGSMRLAEGDELQLSDGNGLRIQVVVDDAQNGVVQVLGFEREDKPTVRLGLIQALAKNGHDEQAIDVATQIGVDEVTPWQADRSIARFKAGRTDRKWMQTLRAATEQSRRAFVPELREAMSSKQLLAQIRRDMVHGNLVIVLHQDANASWSQVEEAVDALTSRCLEDGKPRTISVVVGPEGGISEQEVDAFRTAGALVCVLGSNILRASAAGPVALSLLSRAVGRYR
ncbi:16S rRNA (uracil(1498)-N(3))-methyltransferase [Bifidobacterium canis]|uniref:Ribosomal RNA small subunit methyltransferase E n=1 Tax=Bifidobacterium canis TaxID=2610880 RepID=A0A7K1J3G0_9BIFI|nr:16S rRNA (uracil(1498)-N(3))-methyltransferase [Bifidobacterium canis]MUH59081.1 16S rRNA methyltransferase [Bifidobacterium canis]